MIAPQLSWPTHVLGANYFFAAYAFDRPLSANDFHDWLVQSYLESGPENVLRAAIEAVGMAGMSNVFNAPTATSRSKERYCMALKSMKKALDDPAEAIADTTFMAVILFGLYEVRQPRVWPKRVFTYD
jgi:hypothetical protein